MVDNSVDEAMAGFASRIDVTILADGAVRVVDDGRGIPVDPYPTGPHKGKSAAEVVLTVLHAGGKFGGSGYKVSGGLHGVGVSVVNALSQRLVLEVDRDGNRHRMEFAKGGKPQGKLEIAGPSPRGRTGTSVSFWPDPTVFDDTEYHARTILERLQTMAFLNKGLEIRFRDQRPDHEQEVTYKYSGGIVDFVKHLNAAKESLFAKVASFTGEEVDQQVEVALQWNTGFYEGIHGYANGIATIEGGMHVEGFKSALTRVVNEWARSGKQPLLKEKDENLLGEDIREGLTAIVSVKLREPAVRGPDQGQAGQRLHPLAGAEGHQRQAGRVVAREPHRGQPGGQEGHRRGPGPGGGQERPQRHPAQDGPVRRGHARQAEGLLQQGASRVRAVHRGG